MNSHIMAIYDRSLKRGVCFVARRCTFSIDFMCFTSYGDHNNCGNYVKTTPLVLDLPSKFY